MRVQRWLHERMALDADLMRGAGFGALLNERLQTLGLSSEDDYVALLERSPQEAEHIAGLVAVPETWFFRYPQSFALLVDHLVVRLSRGAASLRMMSIGCATGEEPYGMAMAAVHAGWPPEKVRIEAVDRSGAALERAKQGEYGSFSIRHEIPPWAIRFLDHEPGRIIVDETIRAMVRFRRIDALDAGVLGVSSVDVVFCRNVLIYLNAEARARLLGAITASLVEGGLLLVGHAEQMLAVSPAMKRLEASHAFALQRTEPEAVSPLPTPAVFATPAATPRLMSAHPVRESTASRRATSAATRSPVEVAVAPARAEPDFEAARALADAGRISESEQVIREVLARKGPSAPALELLGTLRRASGDPAGAKTAFEQALYLEPSRPTSLLQLAMILENAGDQAKADRVWDRLRRAESKANDGVSR